MKIYTKTGDLGATSLFGGKRLPKSDLRIEAYGTLDELNACLGLLRDQKINKKRSQVFLCLQDRLFVIGSILAAVPGKANLKIPRLYETDISFLENEIDAMEATLPAMRFFVLPGGHVSVSTGHLARTVCRRAERRVVALDALEKVDPLVLQYLNRLSDYLFVLCRKMARELKIKEMPWHPENDGKKQS
jgi:cob(I)alamin adenosyltransferase